MNEKKSDKKRQKKPTQKSLANSLNVSVRTIQRMKKKATLETALVKAEVKELEVIKTRTITDLINSNVKKQSELLEFLLDGFKGIDFTKVNDSDKLALATKLSTELQKVTESIVNGRKS